MKAIAVSQFKATCLALLSEICKTGSPILVTKKGAPLAQVLPPPTYASKKAWLGCMKDHTTLKEDLIKPAASEHEWDVYKKK